VDNRLDDQVNDPGLLLRVEHVPELDELGESGSDVAGIDGRLGDGVQLSVDFPQPLVEAADGGFQFGQPLVQKGSVALQSRRSLWPIKQLTQACAETPLDLIPVAGVTRIPVTGFCPDNGGFPLTRHAAVFMMVC